MNRATEETALTTDPATAARRRRFPLALQWSHFTLSSCCLQPSALYDMIGPFCTGNSRLLPVNPNVQQNVLFFFIVRVGRREVTHLFVEESMALAVTFYPNSSKTSLTPILHTIETKARGTLLYTGIDQPLRADIATATAVAGCCYCCCCY